MVNLTLYYNNEVEVTSSSNKCSVWLLRQTAVDEVLAGIGFEINQVIRVAISGQVVQQDTSV